MSTVQRVLVVRHGHRYGGTDPQLTDRGFMQAAASAEELKHAGIDVIFSSPMIRALQTAAPLATSLDLKIHVDYGFCELLADGWLFDANPLPELFFSKDPSDLPRVASHLLDGTYTSPRPDYPDHLGEAIKGDTLQRAKALHRHKEAVERALSAVPGARTIVVFAHGSTHDYVADAMAPHSHPVEKHSPDCVPNISVTTLIRDTISSSWVLYGYGEPSPRILARDWLTGFKWAMHTDSSKVGEKWEVDDLRKYMPGGRHRDVVVLTPHSFLLPEFNHVYLLDAVSRKVQVWEGTMPIRFQAEPCDS